MRKLLTILLLCWCAWVSAQNYRIGDVYTAPDGSKGIVYYLHPDGSGGWVVALTDASDGCSWGDDTDVPGLTNQIPTSHQQLLNDTAGYANTQAIRSYQNNSTTYAAGKVDFAHGWVLPSPAQLSILYGQLPLISSAIIGAGGTDLSTEAYEAYWCSAESAFNAWVVYFDYGQFGDLLKTANCRVRAVRSFSNTTVVYDTSLTYLWNTGSTQPYINVSPTQTTTYTVMGTTDYGCSATAEQTIIVGTGSAQTIYDTICGGVGYEANGFTITAEETSTPGMLSRTRTLETVGCSSTLTLQLTVKSPVTSTNSATGYGSYTWNGVTYYESGEYTQTFTAANGCDSVATLQLTIKNCTDVLSVDSVITCDSYVWNDSVYTVSGDYTQTFMAANGCDSIVTLALTIISCAMLDNVIDADCTLPPDSNAFAMTELFKCPNVNSMSTPMVADMDGDGLPEIIACCYTSSAPYYNTGFYVVNGQTGALKYTLNTVQYSNSGLMATIADVDHDGKSELFLLGADHRLYCYNYNGGVRWSSANTIANNYLLSAADVNNDGVAEIVCGEYVYDAQTGVLLLHGAMVETGMGFGAPHGVHLPYFHIPYYMYALGDVDGDETLELCAGNTIYKMVITNNAGTTGNSWSILRQAETPGVTNKDGQTFLVDFDKDGDFDICVIGITHSLTQNTSSHTLDVYVWDGQTSQMIAHSQLFVRNKCGASIPYSGDLNGDGYPEIIFNSPPGMMAYTYDTVSSSMSLMHSYAPFSETAGFTVFDFNQDGRNEIVYRGATQLYIVDGVTLENLCPPITAYSGTITEYPIVADVNADGQAEIIVARAYNNWNSGGGANGWVSVYGSQIPGAWSSARKVWNQWAYSSVIINEDMTVPQYRFDVSTTFPNGKKPFNAFLHQMPYIDTQGDLFNPVADVIINEISASSNVNTVTLTLNCCNIGDFTLSAPYPVTVFANTYGGEVIHTATVMESLPVDSCTQIEITLAKSLLCGVQNLESLWVAVNCAGTGIAQNGNLQPECDTTNNVYSVTYQLQPIDPVEVAVSVCDSYEWNGTMYTESGSYTQTFTAANGCDSVVTLELMINTTTDSVLYAYVMENNLPYILNGEQYDSAGTYYQTLQNAAGCDSLLTLHLTVLSVVLPDNVDSADCVFFPEGTEWGIGQPLISSATAITVTTPMVGDIDDDGQQEIVIPAGNYTVSSTINIFNADVTLKSQIHTVNFYIWNSVGLAKVKWQENEYKNIIVVLGTDKRLHAYDAQGTQLWQSNATFGTLYNESTPLPSVSFADFNHDGWTEIYIGAEIYDAATGVLLSKISGNKGFSGRTWDTQNNVYHTIAADLCGDYNLELAAGNTIYSVDIQSRTDFNANQMTVVKEVPSTAMKMEDNSSIPFTDGNTYLADLNLDGRLDVLVMNVDQSNRVVYLYVWDVETQSIICSKKIGNARKFGTPQIGDINQDGYDEICFIVGTYSVHTTGNNDLIYALRYNPQNNNGELDVLWTTSHSDNSACTGLTLFDFNQDGIAELVYRDRFNLRIINGSLIHHQTGEALTQPYDMAVSPCGSATGIEYPLVVDVDLDGEAEIVVGGATYETDFGHLYIFNSSGEPWAPARKVWNQYMYNVTNVNEDLTIPQYLFNNATAFTDPEGVVRRPFNNFLQQGTTIDQYGRPLYAVPDVVVGPFASSQMIGDSLLLTFSYCNLGDNPLNAPYSITVFANAYGGDMVCTVTVNESLSVDSCMNGKIRVPVGALCAAQPFDTLVIAVNCAGAGIAQNDNLQPECDTTNNMVTLAFSLHIDTTHVIETACDTFDWYEYEGVTQSGDYTHVFTNATGCDSTVIMHLTVFQSTHNVLDTIVCETYTWTEGTGETYTVSDTYTHAYTNADRCASVDTLHLTILHGTHHVLDTTVCESFTWTEGTGETYTVSDTYTYAYINDDGCASTDTLHLTILHGTHHVLDTTVCESFTWTAGTGETYTVSDTYTYAYTNDDGCASVDTLYLTILHGTHHVLDTTVCERFTWTEGTGETYTVSDTYTHSYTNDDGCASVDTLYLTILHGTHHVLDTTVCESFTWTDGTAETYTVSDTYTHSYTNDDGCASTDTLHLTILHGTHHVLDTTVCERFTWTEGTGETYTVSDTYTHAYTNDDGCASTDTLHLTILHGTHHVLDTTVCESFTWTEGTGETYTVSDTYTHSYTNDDGCASTDTLHLTVRPLPVAIINGPSHLCEDSSIVLSSNSAASYQWNTGETTQSIMVHEEGTYTLVVTDEFGCSGDTSLRVSASYNPILNVNIPDMCAGGSYTISVGYQNENNVQLGHGSTTLSMVDTVFLPDGVPCEPHGCSYRSPLTFSAYGRNEVVESVEDIYYVRLNMEHSWAGDIYINITCPNGQKADIMKYGGSGISTCNSSIVSASRGWQSGSNADVGSYFGQAYDIENGSDICNPDAVGNEQGVGWNYCWSNNTTQGYVYAPGDGSLVYRSENEHYGILDSSNVATGTHFYHPDQSFSSLIGCPLNGPWFIEVIDGWDVDNGYIFGWELALRNEVLSTEEAVFTAATSDGPWMTSLNDSLFRLDPPADLTQDTVISYTFHIFDDFGCQYDTTVEVLFFAPHHTIIDTVSCNAIVWNGVQYTVSGSYSDTLTSLHGCDSIVTLNLTINQCYIEENVDTMVCVSAMPYTWHGHLFAQAGEWIDTVDRNDGFFLVTTYQLSVSNPAVTEMGTSQITCFGGSDGQVQVLVSGGVQPYSYHWENAAGTTVATTAQLSNRPAGTYTLYVSDAIGCTTTQTVNLTHLSDSMMAGTIPQTRLVCMGNTLPLVTGTAASGGASSAYQWQFSTNGVNWNAAPTPNNSQNYNYPNAVTSSFFLRRAWVSQACGTVYSNVMSVTVSPLYADTLHDMVCQGYSYQNYGFNISETETAESTFIARTRQLQSSQGCDSSVTLLLTVIAPQHTTVADGTCQHSSYQANGFDIASEQLATAGEYTFEQQYVVNNCDSVVTLHLTVYPEYEVNLQAVVCEGDGYHQHGFNIPAVQTIGIDEVEVSQNLQSQHNCDSVVNLHLTVVDTSIAIVSLTEDFCEEYSADLSVETNATNYVWSTGETTPVITVNQPGLYTVTATQDNCIISAQYQIQKCEFNVYLPNAITPGLGDGINDYFCIHDHYKAMIEDFEIRIYSRWGELVYYSDDKDFKWNGEIKGRIIRQVIYTYLINFTDKRGIPHQLTGNITVL